MWRRHRTKDNNNEDGTPSSAVEQATTPYALSESGYQPYKDQSTYFSDPHAPMTDYERYRQRSSITQSQPKRRKLWGALEPKTDLQRYQEMIQRQEQAKQPPAGQTDATAHGNYWDRSRNFGQAVDDTSQLPPATPTNTSATTGTTSGDQATTQQPPATAQPQTTTQSQATTQQSPTPTQPQATAQPQTTTQQPTGTAQPQVAPQQPTYTSQSPYTTQSPYTQSQQGRHRAARSGKALSQAREAETIGGEFSRLADSVSSTFKEFGEAIDPDEVITDVPPEEVPDNIPGARDEDGNPIPFLPYPTDTSVRPPLPPLGVKPRSMTVIVALALICGPLGLHNMYARRMKLGLIQLVLTIVIVKWLGPITWIWAVAEAVLYLSSSKTRWRTDGQGYMLRR